jgi:peptidyl-dipeptidase Dcp
MSPILSKHRSAAMFLPGLFDKINAVYDKRHDADLNSEQIRLVERIYLDFTRSGASFDGATQKEYAELKAELATLTTQFQQNVMKDEETYEMVLKKEDMSGCPDGLVEAARQAAVDRSKADGEYVITLSRSLVEPFLTFSDRRDLREQAWGAWTRRGELDADRDNLSIATKILKLRKKQAEYHGCKTFAEYQCLDRMAKTPENVMELLENVWERAKKAAIREREALEEFVKESCETLEGGIQPWDWRFYANKVRNAKYNLDETLLKPYLSLDAVSKAFFAVSGNLFGLTYEKRDDVELYHEDVNLYEVKNKEGKLVSLFIHDNFARPFKASGAWMSEYRSQTRNLPIDADEIEQIPVVSNNNNFAKGSPTLLSFDDATTLFHEGGHGHHGMLSDATYSRLSSTSVLTDFVELPSQLMEHWFEEPEVLKKFCRHYKTGEEIPDDLLAKLKAAKDFNQGFETIEYTSCALLDIFLHSLDNYDDFDMTDFEQKELDRLGMPQGIVMRHRPGHFQHLFSTSAYAAGYYVYLWAEVLDADAFAAFKESGDVFNPDVAEKARKFIYSAGNTAPPDELYRSFRGRDPEIQFMLEKKGLV